MVGSISNKSLATNALRNLGNINARIGGSIGKLASGKGILKASDNPAGLAFSERLKSDIGALQKGVENVSQGANLTRVAEGGLQSISSILGQAKSLAIQASSGTLSDSQRSAVQAQFSSLTKEIDRIAGGTEFNGKKLLNGELGKDAPGVNIQVGTDGDKSSRVNINVVSDVSPKGLKLQNVNLNTQASAREAIARIETAAQNVNEIRGDVGSVQNRLSSIANTQNTTIEELVKAESKISDANFSAEVSKLRSNQVLLNAALKGLRQSQFSAESSGRLLNITT